jgi:hypothetical protein
VVFTTGVWGDAAEALVLMLGPRMDGGAWMEARGRTEVVVVVVPSWRGTTADRPSDGPPLEGADRYADGCESVVGAGAGGPYC